MNIAARRVLLQQVLRGGLGLMGVAITGGNRSGSYAHGGPPQSSPTSIDDNGEYADRQRIGRILNKQHEALYKKRGMLQEAVGDMDLDLQALRSTSPTWRAWQMYDRVKARRTISDKINDRIETLWREPFFKIKDQVISWITGEQ